jgi:hypothetical protein
MASGKQFRGEAMVFSTISRLLLRGYNTARPVFDEGDGDDFWVSLKGSKERIRRVQVKSAFLNKPAEKQVDPIQIPQSILDGIVDIVAIALWDFDQTYIGLFDDGDIRSMTENGNIHPTGRIKPTHTAHFAFRYRLTCNGSIPRIFFGPVKRELDVTHHFTMDGGRWDELDGVSPEWH